MKKLLLLAFLLPLSVSAQHEFGYHATWHFLYNGFGFFGNQKVSHVGDTAMLGMNWLKFEVTGVEAIVTGPDLHDFIVDSNVVFAPIFLATRNDSVFRLLNDTTPYLLYDFSAQVGDKWQFAPNDTNFGCDSVPVATVLRKGSHSIGAQSVRFVDVTFPMDTAYYTSPPSYRTFSNEILTSTIYPDFGSAYYSFPFTPRPNLCDGTSFDLSNYELLCFSNDSMSISFKSKPCDFVPIISTDEYEPISFEVFPNPTNAIVNIHSEEEVARVEVYSLDGQKLIETSLTENIELPAYSGLYMIAIYFEDGRRVVTKVVRE